ncbi:hypothetical protein [Chitinivorax sp. B]|uniref:hypothetical protein n=1 Tax=Chitinivorax sp. B TaxID=2502235 RepID=UPI0010F9F482|nr:hypothetical protein [Chitinivorax sp. B]
MSYIQVQQPIHLHPRRRTAWWQTGLCLVGLSLVNVAYADDPTQYATAGVWMGAPLGASLEAGAAIPLSDADTAIIGGAEIGTGGHKYMVGMRLIAKGHGAVWGSLRYAQWHANDHAIGLKDNAIYRGLEAQFLIFKASLMFPDRTARHRGADPMIGLSIGFGI